MSSFIVEGGIWDYIYIFLAYKCLVGSFYDFDETTKNYIIFWSRLFLINFIN